MQLDKTLRLDDEDTDSEEENDEQVGTFKEYRAKLKERYFDDNPEDDLP